MMRRSGVSSRVWVSKLARATPRRAAKGHRLSTHAEKFAAELRIASAVMRGWPEEPDSPLHSRELWPDAAGGRVPVAPAARLSCAGAGAEVPSEIKSVARAKQRAASALFVMRSMHPRNVVPVSGLTLGFRTINGRIAAVLGNGGLARLQADASQPPNSVLRAVAPLIGLVRRALFLHPPALPRIASLSV